MKRYLTNMVISAFKPKVNTTKLDKAKSKLAIAIQKEKGSAAKLKQTQFEIKNPKFKGQSGFTFSASKKKTMSKSELNDQADYLNKTGKYKAKKRNEESKKIFKTVKGEK